VRYKLVDEFEINGKAISNEGDSKMNKKYIVDLATEERKELESRLHSGQMSMLKVERIRILLMVDEGWIEEWIVKALDVGSSTVEGTR